MIRVLSERRPHARREYGCDLACGEHIEAGERHYAQGAVCDGRAYTWRAHLHCHALSAAHYADHGRLWDDEGLAEVAALDLADWSRADVEAACDRQRWAPSHPSRERARALWQGAVNATRMQRRYWDLPCTDLARAQQPLAEGLRELHTVLGDSMDDFDPVEFTAEVSDD